MLWGSVLRIDGIRFNGNVSPHTLSGLMLADLYGYPNVIVPSNFTVTFTSGFDTWHQSVGFTLIWSCAVWGEWTRAADGSCNEERRPISDGETTIVRKKYQRPTSTCCKYYYVITTVAVISMNAMPWR